MHSKNNIENTLLKEPYLFSFPQAAHLLCAFRNLSEECFHGGEKVLFKSTIFLSQPSSDLFAFSSQKQKHLQSIRAQKKFVLRDIRKDDVALYMNFLGIAGAQGPLPLAYTEDMLKKIKSGDTVLADFFDIFNHRFASLFYKLYQRHIPTLLLDTPDRSLLGRSILSLSGVRKKRDSALQLRSFLPIAHILWKRPHTPQGLSQLLKHHFGLSNTVISFVGQFFSIPFYRRTQVGQKKYRNNNLASTFVLGTRAYLPTQGIRICLSIKDRKQFLGFLPKGVHYESFLRVVRSYIGTRLRFELALSLNQAPLFRVGVDDFPWRLGWTSWLGGTTEHAKRQSVCITG